jgi:sprouty-related EVH1 domain-containing protein
MNIPSCEDAPDGVEKCIEYVTCVWCAKGIIYHCMADPDGDYGHPCVCDTSDRTNCKKWTALTILSLFVPCLWCYWQFTSFTRERSIINLYIRVCMESEREIL